MGNQAVRNADREAAAQECASALGWASAWARRHQRAVPIPEHCSVGMCSSCGTHTGTGMLWQGPASDQELMLLIKSYEVAIVANKWIHQSSLEDRLGFRKEVIWNWVPSLRAASLL